MKTEKNNNTTRFTLIIKRFLGLQVWLYRQMSRLAPFIKLGQAATYFILVKRALGLALLPNFVAPLNKPIYIYPNNFTAIMRKLYVLLLLLAVFLSACRQDRDKNKVIEPQIPNTSQTNGVTETDTTQFLPKLVTAKYFFSDTAKPDFFKLEADGFEPKRTMLRFTIINPQGKEIYSDSFKAELLLDDGIYELAAKPTEKERNRYIIDKMNRFFDEKNLIKPAVKSDEEFSPEYSDKQIWDELLKDSTAVGFYYMLAPNKGKSIAYSKKQKKAVVYFSCC